MYCQRFPFHSIFTWPLVTLIHRDVGCIRNWPRFDVPKYRRSSLSRELFNKKLGLTVCGVLAADISFVCNVIELLYVRRSTYLFFRGNIFGIPNSFHVSVVALSRVCEQVASKALFVEKSFCRIIHGVIPPV